jgi:hypothetical protein
MSKNLKTLSEGLRQVTKHEARISSPAEMESGCHADSYVTHLFCIQKARGLNIDRSSEMWI